MSEVDGSSDWSGVPGVPGASELPYGSARGRDGGRDEETVALAAAIRAPWTPPPAQPFEPQPPPRPQPSPSAGPAVPPGAFYPPRPVGYVPMPVYAYPPGGWAPAPQPLALPYPQVWLPYRQVSQRELGIAYLLWFFLGVLGVHHFYLGNILRGVLYLLTGGFLGIGILVDLFLLPSLTRRRNAEAIGRQYPLLR
jgi:TM2 domain-containing membrane protein YozV